MQTLTPTELTTWQTIEAQLDTAKRATSDSHRRQTADGEWRMAVSRQQTREQTSDAMAHDASTNRKMGPNNGNSNNKNGNTSAQRVFRHEKYRLPIELRADEAFTLVSVHKFHHMISISDSAVRLKCHLQKCAYFKRDIRQWEQPNSHLTPLNCPFIRVDRQNQPAGHDISQMERTFYMAYGTKRYLCDLQGYIEFIEYFAAYNIEIKIVSLKKNKHA